MKGVEHVLSAKPNLYPSTIDSGGARTVERLGQRVQLTLPPRAKKGKQRSKKRNATKTRKVKARSRIAQHIQKAPRVQRGWKEVTAFIFNAA